MPLHMDSGQTSEPQGWHRCRQRVDDSRRGHPSGKPGSFWPVEEKASSGREASSSLDAREVSPRAA